MSFDSEKLIQMENLVNKPKVSLVTTITLIDGDKSEPQQLVEGNQCPCTHA